MKYVTDHHDSQYWILHEALAAYNRRNSDEPGEIPEDPDQALLILLAQRFPGRKQGDFTTDDLEKLPDQLRVELIDGRIYLMAVPSDIHQTIAGTIYARLLDFVLTHNSPCHPMIAPFDVRPDADKKTSVQPDVLLIARRSASALNKNFFNGAPALVIEVLSPSTQKRDRTIKLQKYMKSGVREYWIVDPFRHQVIVYLFRDCTEYDVRIYTFSDRIPVSVCEGGCILDFSDITKALAHLESMTDA